MNERGCRGVGGCVLSLESLEMTTLTHTSSSKWLSLGELQDWAGRQAGGRGGGAGGMVWGRGGGTARGLSCFLCSLGKVTMLCTGDFFSDCVFPHSGH